MGEMASKECVKFALVQIELRESKVVQIRVHLIARPY